MSTSGYDLLAGNPTETNGHDTQLYNNDMVRLKDELQTLATDLRTEKDLRMSTEKRLVDTECRIHGILAQLTKMDQDTVTDNQFLVQRLAQMEQTFDNHLAKEINNLADHTANGWISFDKQESENMARLTSNMDDTEEQSPSEGK